jgi:hypothetical protein
MIWYIAAAILLCIALAILVLQYLRDRRYTKSKTSETIGKKLWTEIQDERDASKERHEKFQQALDRAEKGEVDESNSRW